MYRIIVRSRERRHGVPVPPACELAGLVGGEQERLGAVEGYVALEE